MTGCISDHTKIADSVGKSVVNTYRYPRILQEIERLIPKGLQGEDISLGRPLPTTQTERLAGCRESC